MYTILDKANHGYKFCEITFIEFLSMLDPLTMVRVADEDGKNEVEKSVASWVHCRVDGAQHKLFQKAVLQGVKAEKEGCIKITLA